MDSIIATLGFPWYAYGWTQCLVGVTVAALLLSILRTLHRHAFPIPRLLRWSIAASVAFTVACLDVWLVSRTANRLCRAEGGLHVYRTAAADGFFGVSNIAYWSAYGFGFVESAGSGRYSVWTIVDGERHHEYRERLTSRYVLETSTHEPVAPSVWRNGVRMRDVRGDETLGELVTFTIGGGWIDRRLAIEPAPWHCGNVAPAGSGRGSPEPASHRRLMGSADVVKATLIPQFTASRE